MDTSERASCFESRHGVGQRSVRQAATLRESKKWTTSNQRHVVHHSAGGWAVRRPNSPRASSRHQTQAQAQTRAKEILSHGGGGEAVTHKRDGSIRQSDTVHPAAVDWSLLSPQGHVLFLYCPLPRLHHEKHRPSHRAYRTADLEYHPESQRGWHAPPSQERAASSLYDQF